jgi:hypothetical protein
VVHPSDGRAVKQPDYRATELECEATIIKSAKMAGWLVHGSRVAYSRGKFSTPIKGHAGFPDLVLVKGERLIIVELKRRPNKVEPEQEVWLKAFAQVPGVESYVVWVPDQQDAFCQLLFDAR